MKLHDIPTNYDALKVIQSHTDDLNLSYIKFLKHFEENEIQFLICLISEIEVDYIRN